jgi:hypothetical protein
MPGQRRPRAADVARPHGLEDGAVLLLPRVAADAVLEAGQVEPVHDVPEHLDEP